MVEWVGIGLQLVLGLVLLVGGGELLVRGASRVAAVLGISPLVIGLTVVAFGTSSPEMAVSLGAGLGGNPDLAVGNVVGSNIFNVLFILGLCALIQPLMVRLQLVRREVPIMIGVSVLLFLLALDGRISLWDGILLFGGLAIYVIWSILASRKEAQAAGEVGTSAIDTTEGAGKGWLAIAVLILASAIAGVALGRIGPVVAALAGVGAVGIIAGSVLGQGGRAKGSYVVRQVGAILAGLGILVLGADSLVQSATAIARAFHVSDLIIGLTIVAAGTSLPEVATSVIATLRNERDIAIGNVVGSNIFNILGILGLSAMITPGGLNVNPAMIPFDLPIMLGVAVVCLPIFFTGMSIARWEGALFVAGYVAYTLYLVLAAAQNPALERLSSALLLIGPLVLIILGWSVVQALRAERRWSGS